MRCPILICQSVSDGSHSSVIGLASKAPPFAFLFDESSPNEWNGRIRPQMCMLGGDEGQKDAESRAFSDR